MLVYDVTSEKSFENIRNWIRNIEEVSKTKLYIIIIIVKFNQKLFLLIRMRHLMSTK